MGQIRGWKMVAIGLLTVFVLCQPVHLLTAPLSHAGMHEAATGAVGTCTEFLVSAYVHFKMMTGSAMTIAILLIFAAVGLLLGWVTTATGDVRVIARITDRAFRPPDARRAWLALRIASPPQSFCA